MTRRLRFVAGEASGDMLGSLLIQSLKAQSIQTQSLQGQQAIDCAGIAGPKMEAAGCTAWWPSERLSVSGFNWQVAQRIPELFKIRRALCERIVAEGADLFIGIDAPDFNFGLETKLKARGIKTAHFISPSIWAWRGGRIKKIAKAVDHMLCVFPFEPAIYAQAGIPASYVGYPLADRIPVKIDVASARAAFGIAEQAQVLAVLPGSRPNEIHNIAPRFIATLQRLHAARPHLQFVVPLATPTTAALFQSLLAQAQVNFPVQLVEGRSHEVLAAADAVLVASGTATLETALFKKPMVISYLVGPLAALMMRRMGYLPWVGLPNILLRDFVVPELLQEVATAEALAEAVLFQLEDTQNRAHLETRFTELHLSLKQDMPQRAREVIERLLA